MSTSNDGARNAEAIERFQAIIARAAAETEFRQRLVAEPERTLGEAGVDLPDGVRIAVRENTAETLHLPLPPRQPAPATEPVIDNPVLRLLARSAWDDEIRTRLTADPKAALAEAGVRLPAGKTVTLLEDTRERVHFILPDMAAGSELSDADLDNVVGGAFVATAAIFAFGALLGGLTVAATAVVTMATNYDRKHQLTL